MITTTKPKTKLIQTRLDAELVNQASSILGEIGLGLNDAIKIFLKKTIAEEGIPFSLTAKKAKTTWQTSTAPLREPTPEEAKIIEEFIKNPQIASHQEVLDMEKELGIKLDF
jgi:addiction module RelB/DinJ family antitoxin